MTIPIANVYYLLLYAWRHAQRADLVARGKVPQTDLCNLFADALATEASRLISRGLARDYRTDSVTIAGLRGRLELAPTIKRQLLLIGRTQCTVDEFERDVLRNQIIKTMIERLIRLPQLHEDVCVRLRHVRAALGDITSISLTNNHFRTIQSHRNVRHYDFAIQLCRLLFDHTFVDPTTGRTTFNDFREDDATMWRLFEHFVKEFFRVEQRTFGVSTSQIHWFEAQGSDADLKSLPQMQPDVVLDSPSRSIIIDTKFYEKALSSRYGRERAHSANLYQLFTYVENRSAAQPGRPQEGILLYPVIDKPFSFSYVLKGRKLAVRSIDLREPWQSIHDNLLRLIA